MRPSWLALALLLSCSRETPTSGLAIVATSDTAGSSGSPTGATPPAAPGPAPAREPTACWVAAGYRGAVLGLPVFVRLARDGARLHGRYFYERTGIDIALDGALSEDGTLHLVEGPASSPTGRFDGLCEPASGAFAGRWQGGKAGGDFRWVPVPPGETPVLAIKRFSITHPVKDPAPDARLARCSFRESRLELFGLRDESVERTINRQGFEPVLGPVLDAPLARGVERCAEGSEAEVTQRLVGAFRELATIETQGWIDGGGAHPGELDFGRVTLDLRTGRAVTPNDVFVPGHDPVRRVAACAARATPFDVSMDEDEWTSHLDLSQFDLAEDGVHFFGSNFPHVMAVLAGQGPVIGYDVLLRDGLLRTDSPVKRAWRGVDAAAKGKPWCADVKGDAGWR
jgi:hypothetical protein